MREELRGLEEDYHANLLETQRDVMKFEKLAESLMIQATSLSHFKLTW